MNPTAFIPPEPDSASKPSLVCGGASIVLPLLGGVLGYAIVVGKPGGDAGWPNVILGPLVLPASAIFGLVLSGFGFARRERYPLALWSAVLVNIVRLVYGSVRLKCLISSY